MPKPRETDREYAYFQAVGSFNPDDITKSIGLEPSDCWSTGDKFERRGHTFNRRGSSWKLDSGLDDTNSLNSHIKVLLRRLKPYCSGLLDAGTKARLQIVCVSFQYSNFSWELDFEFQKAATALGIGFWIDAYDFSDHHEEMVELREQLGVRADIEE